MAITPTTGVRDDDTPAVGTERFDRVPLLFGPSPVHRLERLSEHLGGAVDIWAKREDCNSGLAYGGNKVRKLEFVLPIALRKGGPVLTAGAIGSHHVYATAMHAAHTTPNNAVRMRNISRDFTSAASIDQGAFNSCRCRAR